MKISHLLQYFTPFLYEPLPKPNCSQSLLQVIELDESQYLTYREQLSLKIPYSKINERKRHTDWAALGLFGLLWKENRIYTIIEYSDGEDDQTIVIDFEKAISFAQAFIYKKMLECRRATESQKLEGPSSSANTPNSSNSRSPIRF